MISPVFENIDADLQKEWFEFLYEKALPPVPKEIDIPEGEIPPIVHQIWIGPERSYNEISRKEWAEYCLRYGLEYQMWNEERIKSVPEFAELIEICQKKDTPPVHISDVLRYNILNKYGGLYVDVDFIPRQNKDLYNDIIKGSEFVAVTEHWANPFQFGGIQCANGIFASVPEHPITKRLTTGVNRNIRIYDINLWSVGSYFYTACLHGKITVLHHPTVMVSCEDANRNKHAYLCNLGDKP